MAFNYINQSMRQVFPAESKLVDTAKLERRARNLGFKNPSGPTRSNYGFAVVEGPNGQHIRVSQDEIDAAGGSKLVAAALQVEAEALQREAEAAKGAAAAQARGFKAPTGPTRSNYGFEVVEGPNGQDIRVSHAEINRAGSAYAAAAMKYNAGNLSGGRSRRRRRNNRKSTRKH